MSRPHTPSASSEGDYEDDAATYEAQRHPKLAQSSTAIAQPAGSPLHVTPTVPAQKRRRVTRACDECRRKKIKCDGRRPCNHCTIYTYECTYYQPSNRRRNPAPQYIEALEIKLQRAENVLRNFMPGINLDDSSLDLAVSSGAPHSAKQQLQPNAGQDPRGWEGQSRPTQTTEGEKDAMLESMVENTGTLDLDDDGYWDFHGHSSGRAFLRRMRKQFGDLIGKPDASAGLWIKSPLRSLSINSSASSVYSPAGSNAPNTHDLPAKECARLLCEYALNDALAILRFIHQPTFYTMLDRVYDIRPESLESSDFKFLPLLYATIALGSLFARSEKSVLMLNGFENAIEQGSHWFKISRSMMDVTDCRDLVSLQTILCMILFLQSSAKLSTSYSHIGLCLRSAIRMGLHRVVSHPFNPVEQETRKRIFWCIRKLDRYVSALLGLPQLLNDDDIDQEDPMEVDDEFITTDKISPMPVGRPSLMAGFNAHTRIVSILTKTVKYIYPIKGVRASKNHSYVVSHAKIREIEQDLQAWMESLPTAFKPGIAAPHECVRIQHLLRMAYAHIEMFLYRPFLHYVSHDIQARSFDKRSYACGAACVSVSRNIVHLTGEMKRRGLLVGSYWFYMYTTFFAIIALIFYVLENPHSSNTADILKDAHEGRDALATLAKRSLAADKCSKHLADLFEQLPDKLHEARMKILLQKKHQNLPQSESVQSMPAVHAVTTSTLDGAPQQTKMVPGQHSQWQASATNLPSTDPSMNPSYPSNAQNPFSTGDGGDVPSQTPDSAVYLHTPTANAIPDLLAMMFPSEDPFAYPKQPLMTLENEDYIKEEPPMSSATFHPSASAEYNSAGGPIFNEMPNHPWIPLRRHRGAFTMAPQNNMNVSGDSLGQEGMATSQGAQGWENQQQAQGVAQGMNVDQLFGEDWGGWMNQGYR